MRFFSYLLFLLIVLSCSGMSKKPSPEERSLFSDADSWISKNLSPEELAIFPDKELKQILIRGDYYPKNLEKMKKVDKNYCRIWDSIERETLQNEYPLMCDRGKERYIHTNVYHCYNAVKIKDRQRCYKDNFRVRVYDKQGEMIAEDCWRLENPEKYDGEGRYSEEFLKSANSPDAPEPTEYRTKAEEGLLEIKAVVAYVPYNENNHEIHIVKLEDETETILASFGSWYIPKPKLIELYYTKNASRYRGFGYDYDAESQCHKTAGPR